MTLVVHGLEDMTRAFALMNKSLKTEWRQGQRRIAEPTRAMVEVLALEKIRNMPRSPKWARMRTGVTQKVVYVAPRQKGTHGRGRHRRPNLADLIAERAMEPALEQHQAQIMRDFERLLDTVGREWER